MIDSSHIYICNNIQLPKNMLDIVDIIANHTCNTWQSNRPLEVIKKDTMIGKVAEFCLTNLIDEKSLYQIIDYDVFRTDNYNKHAPLDFLIFHKDNEYINEAIGMINNDVINNRFGVLEQETKDFLKKNKIYTLEIKSTRVTNRHKTNNVIDKEKILNDDFLAYPCFYRKVNSNILINSWEDYLKLCIENNKISTNTTLEQLQSIELKNMYDFYARVYVEELEYNRYNVFVIGYTDSVNFIQKSTIKRMTQFGKSEQALYIAMGLKNGKGFQFQYII
ncbi:hypothetical protein IO405_000530 [Campylobacter lari]|nr:hypothetical protein [Campylobacter lari]